MIGSLFPWPFQDQMKPTLNVVCVQVPHPIIPLQFRIQKTSKSPFASPFWTRFPAGSWHCRNTSDLQLRRPFFQRALLADQRAQWHKTLLQVLRESKMILANTNTKEYRLNVYPYLCLLEDPEYVDIMIQVTSRRRDRPGCE